MHKIILQEWKEYAIFKQLRIKMLITDQKNRTNNCAHFLLKVGKAGKCYMHIRMCS